MSTEVTQADAPAVEQQREPLRRGGRVPGSEGYNESDVRALLACVEEVLPAGRRDWARVLKLYRRRYAEPHMRSARDVNSIKSKFRQVLNLKPKPSGKLHSSSVEAQRIQIDIKRRLRAIADGIAAAADSGDDSGDEDMDDDAERPMKLPTPAEAAVATAPSDPVAVAPAPTVTVTVAAPAVAAVEPVAPTPTADVVRVPAIKSLAAPQTAPAPQTPERREQTQSTRSTPLPVPAVAPVESTQTPSRVTGESTPGRSSPLRRLASRASAVQPETRDEPMDDEGLSAHQLLSARVSMLEQQNFALSSRMHTVNDAAQQVLHARVAALEQQNSALTARLAVVSDSADEYKNKNFDLREEIIRLKSELARVEAENRALATRSGN